MVRQAENGTLGWLQGGQPVTIIKEDGARYSPALETMDAQNAAIQANKDAEDAYMQDLNNAQVNVDASRPIDEIPVKPPYYVVSDPYYDGTTVTPGVRSSEPWPAPGLPDLKHKTIFPSGSTEPIEEPFQFTTPQPAPTKSSHSYSEPAHKAENHKVDPKAGKK